MEKTWMTLEQAAWVIGRSPRTMRSWIEAKRIKVLRAEWERSPISISDQDLIEAGPKLGISPEVIAAIPERVKVMPPPKRRGRKPGSRSGETPQRRKDDPA